MSAVVTGEKQRWAVATVAAAVVLAALLFLFRVPSSGVLPAPALPGSAMEKPMVELARTGVSDQLLKEETELRDLRPLFLPTARNAALPPLKREPGKTVLDIDSVKPGALEPEMNTIRDLPPVAVVNGKPADQATPIDALASDPGAFSLYGFGRSEAAVAPLEARTAFVEVVASATGERVLGTSLGEEGKPPGSQPWAPLELLARINATGLAAPLIVTTSSGVEEVDAHFRRFLTKTFRIGERLPPGFYRVTVAP